MKLPRVEDTEALCVVLCVPWFACAVAGVPGISQLLANSLWQWVVRPLLLRPLMQAGAEPQAGAAAAAPAAGAAPGHLRRNSGGRGLAAGTLVGSPKPSGHWRWGSGSWGAGEPHVQAVSHTHTPNKRHKCSQPRHAERMPYTKQAAAGRSRLSCEAV